MTTVTPPSPDRAAIAAANAQWLKEQKAGILAEVVTPVASTDPSKIVKQSNPKLLEVLPDMLDTKIVHDTGLQEKLATTWMENAKGSIATFGRVLDETIKRVGGPTATTLKAYLSVIRQEFWDPQAVTAAKFAEEFRSQFAARPADRQAVVDSAKLPSKYTGVLRGVFELILAKAPGPFREAIAAVKEEQK
jgi:hypothetical protein